MRHNMYNNSFSFLSFLIIFLFPWEASSQQVSSPWIQNGIFAAKPAMRQVTLTGYTRARHVIDIISEEAGRCLRVTADTGEKIGKNGLFVELDKTFINLAIEKNRINQEQQKNMVAYQGKEVRRYEKLMKRRTVAQSELDGLQNRLDQSGFRLQTLKLEEAVLKEHRFRHLISVPPGWTITRRAVEPGAWIPIGKQVGTAADFKTLLIPFSLSPEEMNALKKIDGPIDLYFPDEGREGIKIDSSVERISPAFEPETRKISVDLIVTKGLSIMRGGLRTELTLELELPDISGALLVPTIALSERYEDFWLTRENGEKVSVALLGHGAQGISRVRSPKINPGDKFKVKQER